MLKKDLEKLELDIAREKDPEVAERLKAVLETRQRERRERNRRLQTVGIGIVVVIRKVLIFTLIGLGILLALGAIGALILWVAGVQ